MVTLPEPQPAPAIPFRPIRDVLADFAARFPDKRALYDLDQEKGITWGVLRNEANRIANWLARNGVKPGDKVALLADESLEKLLIWLGIWRLGAVVCPLNVEMNQGHLSDLLKSIGPTLTIWHDALDGPKLTAGVPGDSISFGEFLARVASAPTRPEVAAANAPDDMAAIFCTSGTSGRPKCVVYDHRAYWLNGLDTIDFLGLQATDRTLEYRSFGWNSAQVASLMPWLELGCTLHIARRFSHSRFFDWIRKHGITFAVGVPTVVNMLLEKPLGVAADDIPTLRLMTCSTAPLSPEQWQRFEAMYGLTLLQLYGMSEAGWICGNRHYRHRMGTVGPPAKHQEFLIVDGAGAPCPPDVEGEVTAGGPQACMATISPDGVWQDMRGARIKSGDLATMDADGFVRVTGRTKDLIIRGGVNIAPVEIDNVLLQNQSVSEAAAVGVPDRIYGEEVVAYVVAKAGARVAAEEIAAHCAARLPPFKTPKHIYVVDRLPRSDRGKVIRDALREQWLKENKT